MMGKLTEKQIEQAAQVSFDADEGSFKWKHISPEMRRLASDWRTRMVAAAPFLQYAPTAPGAPLSNAERDQVVCISNTGVSAGTFHAFDVVLAKRNTAEPERISALLKQRDQLDAIASNPDWILAPDGMTAEQHIAAGGRFADPRGVIHATMQGDKDEMWLWVLPNPREAALASGMVSLDAVEKAISAYLLDEHGWNVGDALFAASKIRARLSPPKTLQERIEERFRSARDNDDVYTPDALAAIAMEELEKEQK